SCFFFFQAEDGIRDWSVTGVQTCALPISVSNVLQMRRAEGGSTITQQLARNLFLTHERTLTRKLKEIALAVEIERAYSKNQILRSEERRVRKEGRSRG